MSYKLEIYDKTGVLLADLSDRATARDLSQVRNTYDVLKVTFDLDDIVDYCAAIGTDWTTIFAVDENEIRITSDDVVVTSCLIVDALPSIDKDDHKIDITGFGWLHLLKFRYTGADDIYTAQDAGSLAWQLINTSQSQTNGNFGITMGTIQTSINVNREYTSKNILDAITELSSGVSGFDFEVTWDKKFNVYYPKVGSDRTADLAFTYPGNVMTISFERDGTKLINKSIAIGSGSGVNVSKVISTDATSELRFLLREGTNIVSDLAGSDALQARADADMLLYKTFLDIPTIVTGGITAPPFTSYRTGDLIPLVSTHPAFSMISGLYRVDSRELTLDENDFESVKITLMK